MKKLRIIVSMGDPAGIGPEIILKSLTTSHLRTHGIIISGSAEILAKCASKLGIRSKLHAISNPDEASCDRGIINVLDHDNVNIRHFKPGKANTMCAQAALSYIETAARTAIEVSNIGIVTAPIHKGALRLAGIRDIGHTEILQRLTKSPETLTMFLCGNLRVFFLTRHLSLKQAIATLDKDHIAEKLELVAKQLKTIGIPNPKIALAALNPHASDNGLFGEEEKLVLEPAVRSAVKHNIRVMGPIPADSVFHAAASGKYDAVLSLYHDQGHIACKTLDFHRTVSVTLGLPFIRTSVDHGTAFDMAWKGLASPVSMNEAITRCVELVTLRSRQNRPYRQAHRE